MIQRQISLTECLRIRNAATHLSRMCTQEVQLDSGDGEKIRLYPGDIALVASNSMHLDERYFLNPEKFDPTRFSADNGGAKFYIDQRVFLPFGDGPRQCPGNRFGFVQTKMFLAAIVSHFDITINEKTPKDVSIHPNNFLSTIPNCYLNFNLIDRMKDGSVCV